MKKHVNKKALFEIQAAQYAALKAAMDMYERIECVERPAASTGKQPGPYTFKIYEHHPVKLVQMVTWVHDKACPRMRRGKFIFKSPFGELSICIVVNHSSDEFDTWQPVAASIALKRDSIPAVQCLYGEDVKTGVIRFTINSKDPVTI